jgi:DNA (cytosine-5)-methyltransferase 3A
MPKYIAGMHGRFLVENVASMTWIDREEISKYLRVQPLELDSIELTPSRRKRLYWTNIPHPARLPRVREHPSTFVQSCLHNAIALEEKTGVLLLP